MFRPKPLCNGEHAVCIAQVLGTMVNAMQVAAKKKIMCRKIGASRRIVVVAVIFMPFEFINWLTCPLI